MLLIHVNFAQACVGWLKVNPALTGNDLIARFNASEHSRPEQYARELNRGQNSTGKADNFFTNGYFLIQHLKAMAKGTLPLPVRLQQVLEQPASASGNSRDRKRQRRQRRSSGSSSSRESQSGGETADSSSSSGVPEQRRRSRRERRPAKAEIAKMRKEIDAGSSDTESEQRMWDAGKRDPEWQAELDRAVAHYEKARTGRNIELDKLRNRFKIREAEVAAAAAASAARGEGAATTAAVAVAEAAAASASPKGAASAAAAGARAAEGRRRRLDC
jgi:hypothetical protein